MRVINSVLATIFALALIGTSAVGIVYLVGVLTGISDLTALVESVLLSLRGLGVVQMRALLLGIALASLVLFVLEVRPWRPRLIVTAESEKGRTYIQRSDIEKYLIQRLAGERALSPDRLGLKVNGAKFDIAAAVSVSTLADVAAVRKQVE
ncbi:MAG TPA: hypothetical protein DE036_06465, partial [Actinobacteria bacterium]|nr:hypothetical protein [Actinomycetota bacterium]